MYTRGSESRAARVSAWTDDQYDDLIPVRVLNTEYIDSNDMVLPYTTRVFFLFYKEEDLSALITKS